MSSSLLLPCLGFQVATLESAVHRGSKVQILFKKENFLGSGFTKPEIMWDWIRGLCEQVSPSFLSRLRSYNISGEGAHCSHTIQLIWKSTNNCLQTHLRKYSQNYSINAFKRTPLNFHTPGPLFTCPQISSFLMLPKISLKKFYSFFFCFLMSLLAQKENRL